VTDKASAPAPALGTGSPPLNEAAPSGELSPGADERGILDVRVRAIQHIAEKSALNVKGSVAHNSLLDKISGGGTPSAHVTMVGHSARIRLTIATVWPSPVAKIGRQVQDAVRRDTARLAGVDIRTVDVHIRVLTPTQASGSNNAGSAVRRVQ
jgi:uncharacterized alkaline shock family protein YloU